MTDTSMTDCIITCVGLIVSGLILYAIIRYDERCR